MPRSTSRRGSSCSTGCPISPARASRRSRATWLTAGSVPRTSREQADDRAVTETVDAVVIGGGHHGLIAAAALADAGWEVCLLEAQPEIGGAVRSAELFPGFVCDLF